MSQDCFRLTLNKQDLVCSGGVDDFDVDKTNQLIFSVGRRLNYECVLEIVKRPTLCFNLRDESAKMIIDQSIMHHFL